MAPASPRTRNARRLAAPAWVRPEALNVAPALLGAPLAPHGRRALAIGADVVVVALLSSTGSFWIAAGIAALVFQLRRRRPERSRSRQAWSWLALALLVFVAVQHATRFVERWTDPAAAQATAVDNDDNDVNEAAELIAAHMPSSTPAAFAASGAAEDIEDRRTTALREVRAATRIAKLETEPAEARKPRPIRWRDDLLRNAHALGLGFGWAVAYFTLLPFWWQGQTVGKRLFGLRVVELTGKPPSLMTSFGRYGGYAAGMATGGAGFVQVLWDSNRQAVQDKLAHTVVMDLRAPRAPATSGVAPALPLRDATIDHVAFDAPREESAAAR